MLGLPAYGRTFSLKNPSETGLFVKTYDYGPQGDFTKTSGFLSYYELCLTKKNNNYKNIWLPKSKSSYMYKKNDWISYEDIKSFRLRVTKLITQIVYKFDLIKLISINEDRLCSLKKISWYFHLVNRYG